MKRKSKWGFVIVGAVAVLTLGAIGVASAASTTSTASPSPAASAPAGTFHGDGHHGGLGDIPEALASLTGLDEATIMQQRAAGTSFLEIAKSKGVSEAQVIAEVTKLETAELDAAVKSGQITEAQRTQYLSGLQASIKQALTDTQAMPAHGPGGHDGDGPTGSATGSGTSTAPTTSGATTQTTYQTY
jgi:hypothetical protein